MVAEVNRTILTGAGVLSASNLLLVDPAPFVLVDPSGFDTTTENVYPHGSVLKARVLFHNAGNTPVVFQTETWHQDDTHTVRDAKAPLESWRKNVADAWRMKRRCPHPPPTASNSSAA